MLREDQWKLIDNFKRHSFLKTEIKNIILKSLIKNNQIPLIYKYFALYNKNKLPRFNLIIQQKNKCVKTGRIWSTEKFTKYSRFTFRHEANNGNLPGFKRASW